MPKETWWTQPYVLVAIDGHLHIMHPSWAADGGHTVLAEGTYIAMRDARDAHQRMMDIDVDVV